MIAETSFSRADEGEKFKRSNMRTILADSKYTDAGGVFDFVAGRGTVVGACSVVTKDVAPYTVVTGSPAQPIDQSFP